jgi:hypothetical protein
MAVHPVGAGKSVAVLPVVQAATGTPVFPALQISKSVIFVAKSSFVHLVSPLIPHADL